MNEAHIYTETVGKTSKYTLRWGKPLIPIIFIVLAFVFIVAPNNYALVNSSVNFDTNQLEEATVTINSSFDTPNVFSRLYYNNSVLYPTRTTTANSSNLSVLTRIPRLNADTNFSIIWDYQSHFDNSFFNTIPGLVSYFDMNYRFSETNNGLMVDANNSNFRIDPGDSTTLTGTASFRPFVNQTNVNARVSLVNVTLFQADAGTVDAFINFNFTDSTAFVTATQSSALDERKSFVNLRQDKVVDSYTIMSKSNSAANMQLRDVNDSRSKVGLFDGYVFNHGELNGDATVNFSNGKFGQGAGFDGVGDFINISTIIPLISGDIFGSISFWMNPRMNHIQQAMLGFSDSDENTFFFLQVVDSGKLQFLHRSDGSNQWTIQTVTNVSTDTWTHIALTQSGVPLLYINGQLATVTHTGVIDNSSWFRNLTDMNVALIGARDQGGSVKSFYNGTLDSIRFWNRSLTAIEVLSEFNNETLYTPIGHELYFQMPFENGNSTYTFDENSVVTNFERPDLGQSMRFDGINDFVNLTNDIASLLSNERGAIAYWINPYDFNHSRHIVFGDGESINRTFFILQVDTAKRWTLEIEQNNNRVADVRCGIAEPNQWTHILVNQNGTRPEYYINGEHRTDCVRIPASSNENETFWLANLTGLNNLKFGSAHFENRTISTQPHLNGSLDEIMFFNRSLTNEEIRRVYNRTFRANTTEETQQAFAWGIDNCTNFNIRTLNISFYDQDSVSTNIDFANSMNYWNTNISYVKTLAFTKNAVSNVPLCIYPSQVTLTADHLIEYTDANPTVYNFFRNNVTYDNTTEQLSLFTQNGTTQVLFTVQDTNSDPINNSFIHVLKFDVGTGTYTTTEILRTDIQGQAIGNIILGTTFYQFLIYLDGNLIYTEVGVKLISTTRTFTVNLGEPGWLDEFTTTLGVNTNLYYNNATNNFVYTWSDPSSVMHFGCLRVDKTNVSQKITLYDNCTESTSGTIVFNIGTPVAGTEYYATGYLKFDDKIITDRIVESIEAIRAYFNQKPQLSLFIAFLWCLTLFLIGIPNPTLSLSLLGLGLITSSYLGLYAVSGLQIGSAVILILIQIYMAGKQQR